jgi:hypothetical protein
MQLYEARCLSEFLPIVWKAVVNDELLYLTELDRLTECYECAPCGMDTCDSVSSGLGV